MRNGTAVVMAMAMIMASACLGACGDDDSSTPDGGLPDPDAGLVDAGNGDAAVDDDAVVDGDAGNGDAAVDADAGPQPSWYQPGIADTWQWQLTGTLNTSYDVDLYDVDLFETSDSAIQALQTAGRHVICYFSAGSSENWRPDFGDFLSADMGNNLDGWAGERWLDIRSTNVQAIMLARLDLAAQKGCDGVEPDNVDGYTNNPGFPLTAADQLTYNQFLADSAHAQGLSVGLKNDLDQVASLVTYFDFSVNEECHSYNECDLLQPFLDAGKPVFNAEYTDTQNQAVNLGTTLCPTALSENLRTLILPWDLDDSYRVSCD